MAHKFDSRDDVRLFLAWVGGAYGKDFAADVTAYYYKLADKHGEKKAIKYISEIIDRQEFTAIPARA